MEQEVDTLLRKEAIEHVPPLKEFGFYSRYFIILKQNMEFLSSLSGVKRTGIQVLPLACYNTLFLHTVL